ncbi:hypothetical protein DFJ74DRAFT_271849 [Hyaloraphidium curvatum]|nr:hypothetical protein DFJ74DRAFT_271849 [Hyaloraphidium curvatum]
MSVEAPASLVPLAGVGDLGMDGTRDCLVCRGPLFTTAEPLAMFPAHQPPAQRLLKAANAPEDALESQLGSEVLGRAELLAGVTASPVLRGLVWLQLALTPFWVKSLKWFMVVWFLCAVGLGPALFLFNDGRFPLDNLAVGYACVMVLSTTIAAASLMGLFLRGRTVAARDQDLSGHPLAVFARWRQLVDSGASEKPGSAPSLVLHSQGDPLCPCGECVAPLFQSAVALRLLEQAYRTVISIALIFFGQYTVLVTFSERTWSSPWSAFVAAAFRGCAGLDSAPETLIRTTISSVALTAFIITTNSMVTVGGNVAAVRLGLRLHSRGLKRALSSFLDNHETALFRGGTFSEVDQEPFVGVCERLAFLWRNRFPAFSSTPYIIIGYVIAPLVGIVANIAAGTCVPLWCLLTLAFSLVLIVTDIINFASSNSQVSAASSLLLRAYRESKLLLARAGVAGLAGTPAARSLSEYADLIAAYAQADGCEARFMGFVVRYGTARTFAVTMFTVGVGLWSILRTAGVTVTLDTACME